MATSAVAICNLALSRIGVGTAITSLAASSQEAIACNAVYESMRDLVLRDFPWPFARTWVALGLVTDASEEDDFPAWGDDWRYAYRYPSDCIRALRMVDGTKNGTQVPYALGSDSSGRLIYTDEADAVLVYTTRFEDPAHFDPSFASALAWKIAAEIAVPLARAGSFIERAETGYRQSLAQAAADALNEEVAAPDGPASWIADRGA